MRALRVALAIAVVLAGTLALSAQPAGAQTTPTPGYTVTGVQTQGKPPESANLTVNQAGRIASANEKVQGVTDSYGALQFRTGFIEPGRWIVDFRPVDERGEVEDRVVAQVLIDDSTGEVAE